MAILKMPRFWPPSERPRASELAAPHETDGLDTFGSETLPTPAGGAVGPSLVPPAPPSSRTSAGHVFSSAPWLPVAKWTAVIAVTAAMAVASVLVYQRRFAPKATNGSLTVETDPANLEVLIAGKSLGRTPLTVPLAAGAYDITVGDAPLRRTIKANVTAGVASVQHLDFGGPQVLAPETGSLRVQTEPSKLAVQVDGVDRGLSPITVDRLDPGEHDVSVRTDHGVVRRNVKLQPRETLSLIVAGGGPTAEAAAMIGGWLAVSSPIAMQLREAGKVIGTTESARIMLPAGDHEVEIVNEALGYRSTRKVRIAAGKTAATRIELPNGSLSVNAQPWAEVWIDGERIGETPIGNLQRPIGTHQVLFRHPQWGERQESVVITLLQQARLGIDLRKK